MVKSWRFSCYILECWCLWAWKRKITGMNPNMGSIEMSNLAMMIKEKEDHLNVTILVEWVIFCGWLSLHSDNTWWKCGNSSTCLLTQLQISVRRHYLVTKSWLTIIHFNLKGVSININTQLSLNSHHHQTTLHKSTFTLNAKHTLLTICL